MVLKMIYDAKFFDEVFERRGHDAVKWDNPLFVKDNKDIVPMWVADMDFKIPQCVQKSVFVSGNGKDCDSLYVEQA